MRVLLDENVPRKLKHRFSAEHSVATVTEQGWAGLLNGALLRTADEAFDAFVTLDRGLAHQQDVRPLSLRIVVVRAVSNTYADLLPLMPLIEAALAQAEPGTLTHVPSA